MPAASRTNDRPSNTNSSWPPTRFTYTTGQPILAIRRCSTASRSAGWPMLYGEALTLTITSAPPAASRSTAPPSIQMSSQIEIPTATPATSKSASAPPALKWRCSSKTP